jgi:hypothetical protein
MGKYPTKPVSVATEMPTSFPSRLTPPGPIVIRFGSLVSTSKEITLAFVKSGNSLGGVQEDFGKNMLNCAIIYPFSFPYFFGCHVSISVAIHNTLAACVH